MHESMDVTVLQGHPVMHQSEQWALLLKAVIMALCRE